MPAHPSPLIDPSLPLSPEHRSDLAYRLAHGHTWEQLGPAYGCNPDDLRRAAENDPAFPAAEARAWAAATREGEADGLRRLRFVATTGKGKGALRAMEVLVKYAAERRRDETRLTVERERNATRLAVEAARTERALAVEKERTERALARKGERDVGYDSAGGFVLAPAEAPETPEEREKRFARERAARAAEPSAEVYVWGGRHVLGRSHGPDASDVRVKVKEDYSCGCGGGRGIVYWVVPESVELTGMIPAGHAAAEAADALQALLTGTEPAPDPSA